MIIWECIFYSRVKKRSKIVELIIVGKRSLYNPMHYKLKEYYKKHKDLVIIDCMFTWDLPQAKAIYEQKKKENLDKEVILTGRAVENTGNFIDWKEIDKLPEPLNQEEDYQVIKISYGCPNGCQYCFASKDMKVYPTPPINRNLVKITDENMMVFPQAIEWMDELGSKKVNGKAVYYELICGIDFRNMSYEKALALKRNRFINVRLAWDFGYVLKDRIENTVKWLVKAGYNSKDLSVFMLTNWKIPYDECLKKLETLWQLRVKINDCCWNCSYRKPISAYWTLEEIKKFRKAARKHNHLVLFDSYDPELHRKRKHPVYSLLREAAKKLSNRRPLMQEEEMLVRPKNLQVIPMPIINKNEEILLKVQINTNSGKKY